MSFGQCLAILKARWKGALLLFLLTVTSAVAVSLLLPKQYTATASVVVDFKPDPVTAMMYGNLPPPGLMGTQVEVLQSERVARRVIRNLKLAESPRVREQWLEATTGVGSIETWLLEAFQRRLDVKPSREAGVISVSYKAPDPNFAAGVANAFVQAYLETTLALRVDPAKQYSAFFDTRAKEARDTLEKAQTRLSDFQKAKGITATDERLDIETARLSELSTQAVMLQGLTSESGSRQAQARGAAADRMQEVLSNPLIGTLKADLSRAEARLQELNARLGTDHPQVLEAKANIESLRSKVEAEIQRVRGGVGVSDSIVRQRGADVRAALDAQRAQVLRMKAVRDEGAVLVRDVESSQRAYEAVVARFNQSTLESQTTQSNVNLLTTAEPPLEPSSPKILLNIAVAVVLGGLLAVGGTLLLELMNRRVRSAQDVSGTLGLPVLGMLVPPRRRLLRRFDSSALARKRMVGVSRAPGHRLQAPAPARSGSADRQAHEQIDVIGDGGRAAPVMDRSIGDLIAESCKLKPEHVEKIVAHQRVTGMRFGEAAIELGLATTEDVLFALSRQYHYPYAAQDQRKLSPELVALNQPFSSQAESFRAIRSQVMKRVFNDRSGPRRALAVVSPNAGDGKTFFAANLAVSLAQLGGRTLLVDADLRGPRQHEVFNLANVGGLAGILSGRIERDVVQAVPGVPGLFVLPVGNTPPNPLELVERPAFGLLMRELTGRFDYVVVDTPAAEYGADAAVIAEQCGASLMLARRDASRIAAVEQMAVDLLDDGSPKLTGVVVNHYRA